MFQGINKQKKCVIYDSFTQIKKNVIIFAASFECFINIKVKF